MKKLYYGWVIVFAGALIVGAGVGILMNCSSVFVKPVTEGLSLSRGGFTLYLTIQSLVTTFMTPFIGRLFNRHSIRKVITISAAYCCTIYFCFSFATQAWHFYILGAMYGLAGSGITSMAAGTLVNRWFKTKKGLATGLAYCGSGFTASTMIIVSTHVIENMGWQWGYRVQGIAAAICFGIAFLLIRDNPEDIGLLPYGAGEGESTSTLKEATGLTTKAAMKTPTFAMLAIGFFISCLVGVGINPHIVAALTDVGYDTAFASQILSAAMFLMVFTKVLLGMLFDKLGPIAGGFVTGFMLMLTSFLLLIAGLSPIIPYIFVPVFGIACATLSVPYPYMTGAAFGDRDFASIFSLMTMSAMAGTAVGPSLTGFVYDITGSYSLIFIAFIVLSIVMAALLMTGAKIANKQGYSKSVTGEPA